MSIMPFFYLTIFAEMFTMFLIIIKGAHGLAKNLE